MPIFLLLLPGVCLFIATGGFGVAMTGAAMTNTGVALVVVIVVMMVCYFFYILCFQTVTNLFEK